MMREQHFLLLSEEDGNFFFEHLLLFSYCSAWLKRICVCIQFTWPVTLSASAGSLGRRGTVQPAVS